MRIGFIGLGNIGRPMAERLVKAGMETVVFDVREEACRPLVALGARAAESIAALAAAADVIGVCVRDDAEVRQVAGALLEGAARGVLIAIHSTILPRTVIEVAAAARRRGIDVVDAPMTGGAAGAEKGTLTYMVGGDAALVDRCRPLLAASAAKIVHTGALGSGAATKLCNNLIGYMAFLSAYETALLARHASLSFEALLEVTRANGYMTEMMATFLGFRRLIEEKPDDAALQDAARRFTDLAEKDLAVTLAFARENGVTLPGAGLCQQLMARVYGLRDDKRR